MPKVWISLGSNQNREHCLRTAITALRERYGTLQISPLYESDAIGFEGDSFYNLVIGFETNDSPQNVMLALHGLEQFCGRMRNADKFSPRTLDLDLLTWGDEILQQDGINLPRTEILQYAFVLRPLSEIAALELHPQLQQTYQSLWAAFDIQSQPLRQVTLGINHLIRTSLIERNTLETKIIVSLNLDGTGVAKLQTGVPFLEHMLEQVARHGLIDLDVTCSGDTHIDDHHTVEDIGITIGMAIQQALSNKVGLCRYGHSYVPLDEALSRVVIDLSGRSSLNFNVNFTRARIGNFDVDLIREFFQALANNALITIHIDNLCGINAHHQAETIFKAFGRALRIALTPDSRLSDLTIIPSTKGVL